MPALVETPERDALPSATPRWRAAEQNDGSGELLAKDARTGERQAISASEFFLLSRFDGLETAEEICEAYRHRFAEALSVGELYEFVAKMRQRGLLPETTETEPSIPVLAPTALTNVPPPRREDLLIRGTGHEQYVVKDPRSGNYYELGAQEHFLLARLDGEQASEEVCRDFEARFGEPLSESDFEEFLALARAQGFLRLGREPGQDVNEAHAQAAAKPLVANDEEEEIGAGKRRSLLYWRVNLFDPDAVLNRLTPKLWFLWTPAFLVLSLLGMVVAGCIVWNNWGALVTQFADAFRWQTVVLVWLTLLLATTLHEFAHGLTCKHFGGEVHEIGFLSMFFIPCLYCNVSDAWLIREKWKRLLVTLAGGWCDLCLWALAVLVWRVTLPNTLPNYLSWVALTVLSARVVFNFNPFLKLDGYYLLSDWKNIPNLYRRGAKRVKGHVRHLLWGAPAPAPEANARFITGYGFMTWAFSALFFGFMLVALLQALAPRWGWGAFGLVGLLGYIIGRNLFRGVAAGEIRRMIRKRRKRTMVWGGILAGVLLVLFVVPMEDRVSGTFHVRPVVRAEVRAPVTAFVREIHCEEGDRVSPGTVIVRLEIPDLSSRTAQKKAEMGEADARLRLLEAGPRAEELREQRQRVLRAREWRDLAQQHLERARKSTQEELLRLDKLIAQNDLEVTFAQRGLDRTKLLRDRGSVSEAELQETTKDFEVSRSRTEQARARKRALEAMGTLEAETELARRAKDLADAESTLTLMEAGTRTEAIDAARAVLTRTREELRYLESLQDKLEVRSPVGGLITTPRLKDKVGHYLREGEMICQVEEPQVLEAELLLSEQDVARVEAEFPVELKARALPLETFATRVARIAPSTVRAEAVAPSTAPPGPTQSSAVRVDTPGMVVVYCRLEGVDARLRPGMTGFARVSCGHAPIGEVLVNRVRRFLRTEFW